MAFSTLTNLVRVTTATTGTGTLTLGSAITGFNSVPAGLDGLSVTYEIAEPGSAPTAREVGRGVYTNSGATLTRTNIFASTNGGSAINLTSGAAYVSLSLCADDIVNQNSPTMANLTMNAGGDITCGAGTTTANPLSFIAGTNLTSPANGSVEYDGNALMFTPSSTSRGAIPAVQFCALTASYTLTSTTALQKIFNTPSNGSLTVTASTRYMFEGLLSVASMSATSGNAKFDIIGAGNAAFTSTFWCAIGLDATTIGSAVAVGGSGTATNVSSGNIITAASGTAMFALLKGQFRVNTGGTIIPSIGLTTAAAAVVQPDTYFSCWPVSSSSAVSLGNWT